MTKRSQTASVELRHQPRAKSGMDLIGESRSLLAQARSTQAPGVKVVVGLSHLEAVLSTVAAGTSSDEHSDSGPITIQTIIGKVRINLAEGRVVLGAGGFMALDSNVRHVHEGIEDSVVLITFAWPNAQSGRCTGPSTDGGRPTTPVRPGRPR